jgi:3',5'-cyclic AMP phosphodiesterase CpdA
MKEFIRYCLIVLTLATIAVGSCKSKIADDVVVSGKTPDSVLVSRIIVGKKTLRIDINTTEAIGVTVSPENATNTAVTWRSIDPAIAAVDDKGTVTARAAGRTKIIVTAAANALRQDSCTVIVRGTGNTTERPRFVVISDTHLGNDAAGNYNHAGGNALIKVPRAVELLTNKDVDAIFVVGDLTDHGENQEYDDVKRIFLNAETKSVADNVDVYLLMGNHDHYSGAVGQTNYLARTAQPMHQYIIVKEYPFITISETGSDQNDYDETATVFLANKMAEAARDYPDKPIFVFIHVPMLNTAYGSRANSDFWDTDGGWATDRFLSTLNKYPQAIVFSGHTHYPLGDPRSIFQGNFTAVNTAGTTYSEVEGDRLTAGTYPDRHRDVTEGLIVTVKDNNDVEMERWDTYRGEEILPRWLVRAPHNGAQFAYTHAGKRGDASLAPSFAADVKPHVTDTKSTSCKISFPQAKASSSGDGNIVFDYIVEIVDSRDVVARAFTTFSGFYLNSEMPDSITVDMSGLTANTEYTARVRARDSYKNESAAIASVAFRTSNATFAAELKGHWLFDDEFDLKKAATGEPLTFSADGVAGAAGPTASNKAVTVTQTAGSITAPHNIGVNGSSSTYTAAYTIMMDVSVSALGRWICFYKTKAEDSSGDLWINQNGAIGFAELGGYTADAVIAAGVWYRVILSVDLAAQQYKVFINGALKFTASQTGGAEGNFAIDPATVFIGYGPDADAGATIDIAEVAIWGGAFTDAQAAALGGVGQPINN